MQSKILVKLKYHIINKGEFLMHTEEFFYSEATKRFIDYSSKDATAIIAHEHGILGLARLIACLDSLGLDYNETFMIALPDFTYTRNPNRWGAGFPYGCIVNIPKSDTPFIPIDFRPNCCGVVFAEIPDFSQNLEDFRDNYYTVINKYEKIHTNDLNRRNHFLAIYRSKKNNKYYCLLHCSFKYVKQSLYSEHNPAIKGVKVFNYLSKNFHYLINEDAIEYYNAYKQYEKDTLHLRKMIIKELFNDAQILFNKTHEGFLDNNTLLLGAYANDEKFTYPLMLSPESNLYIVCVEKAIKIGSGNSLYCAPHGGGYALDAVISAQKLNKSCAPQEEYLLKYSNNCAFVTNNILDMPFNYRSNTANDWCSKYSMASIKDILIPLINLKL